jgi:trehalose 6-phosphate phosphatase
VVPAIAELLEPLRANPGSSAILCDIDGTLAPIAERPELAEVPQRARGTLRRLAERYALVACVSGRRAAEARSLVGVEGLIYIGNHGFEALWPDGEGPRVDAAVGGREDRAREFVESIDEARLAAVGLRVEDKGPIQALHWRGAPSAAAAELQAKEVAALAQASGLVPRWGRKVLEIRPVAGIDKGSAILRLLLEHRAVDRALYGGDDRTDLDAFRALRWMASGGRLAAAVCVGISSEEGPAEIAERSDIAVEDPEAFLELLETLIE